MLGLQDACGTNSSGATRAGTDYVWEQRLVTCISGPRDKANVSLEIRGLGTQKF